MRFKKTNVNQSVVKTEQKNEEVKLTPKTYLKRYFQSYLSWMFQQNNQFFETLKIEEITNFFLQELEHPAWIELYLKRKPFYLITEANQYFLTYGDLAEVCPVSVPITLKHPFEGLEPVENPVFPPASPDLSLFVSNLLREEGVPCPPVVLAADAEIVLKLEGIQMENRDDKIQRNERDGQIQSKDRDDRENSDKSSLSSVISPHPTRTTSPNKGGANDAE